MHLRMLAELLFAGEALLATLQIEARRKKRLFIRTYISNRNMTAVVS